MAYLSKSVLGATDCNTRTQYFPIRRQLELGFRYFDLRPAVWSGLPGFHLAHCSVLRDLVVLGAMGQSLAARFRTSGNSWRRPTGIARL